MVPLLLLLLLPEALSDQVCLNISDGEITIRINATDIVEKRPGNLNCSVDNCPCHIQCMFSNLTELRNVSSVCLDSEVEHGPQMVEYKITDYSTCSLHLCTNISILPAIGSLESDSSDQSGMKRLLLIRNSCQNLFSSDFQVKKAFIRMERQMIHKIMETSHPDSGGFINYSMQELSLNVFNISEAQLDSSNSRIQLEAPQLLPENMSYIPDIWLPAHALHNIPKDERIIGLVSYTQHSQFQFDKEKISSMVVRIEQLGTKHLHNLRTPIKMTFRIPPNTDMGNESRLQCYYFDENDGCES
ncbi:uncharacterized protein LOC121944322 [Plectropomus leopardus]|uniref:uncharacterized protein LOC121944322 n=1 Tax=Plectropomus leopardus TaxID=160734 RepID=UPI001C4C81D7|nr:uncharacterized protein LOC121944322 [Plectropomus leopardus]